jgi:uncharacterized protein (TIGR02996 family)
VNVSIPSLAARPEVLAFLADAKANPEDDTARLVLADWLDDHAEADEDRARAEFLRLQCQRAAAEGDADERKWELRERELLRRFAPRWLGPLAGLGWTVRRGLVHLQTTTRELLGCGRALTAADFAWVEALTLTEAPVQQFERLLRWPHLLHLHTLSLRHLGLGNAPILALARSAHVASLQTLDLAMNELTAEAGLALAESPHLRRLVHLDLSYNRLESRGARYLAYSQTLGGLGTLKLARNRIDDEGALALASAPYFGPTFCLNLYGNPGITSKGETALEERYRERLIW